MKITKCYKYRIEPTSEQAQKFLQFAGCRRYVWNWALEKKSTHYKETKETLEYSQLAKQLVELKKQPATSFLKECHSQILQQGLMDLEKSFKAFFKKIAKYPKFKSKKNSPLTFRIPQNVNIIDNRIVVPKVGLVKARIHRAIEGTVKSATFKQECNNWYVVFVAELEVEEQEHDVFPAVGIDTGLESFTTLDNGEKIQPPKFYRKAERKLKRLQRKLSKSQKGSHNRSQAKQRLAKYHNKVQNQRANFLQQTTTALVKEYNTFCVEDLNLRGLARTKRLAKSFTDASIGSYYKMLEYKTEWTNKLFVKIDRWFASSKTCHVCGHKQYLELSDRQWICEGCNTKHDRDTNAAINIKIEGLKLVAVGSTDTINASGVSVRP